MWPDVPKGRALQSLRGSPNSDRPLLFTCDRREHWEQSHSLGDNPAGSGQNLESVLALQKRRRHGSLSEWFSDVLRVGAGEGLSADKRGGDLLKRAGKLARCCSYGAVHVPGGDPTAAAWVPYRCDDRFCPDCHWHRTKGTRRRLLDRLNETTDRGDRVRFTTLTAGKRGRFKTPAAAYEACAKAFRRFTRTEAFGAHVAGYFAAFEVTVNAAGELHPHWHILWCGKPWPDTANAWARFRSSNGGALDYESYLKQKGRIDRVRSGVYMRDVWGYSLKQPAPATQTERGQIDSSKVWEVTKYVAAPPIKKIQDLPDPRSVQALQYARIAADLAGRRMGRTGGSWWGIQKDQEKTTAETVHVTTIAELERLAMGSANPGPRTTADRITTPGGDLDPQSWALLCLDNIQKRLAKAWERQNKKETRAGWRRNTADIYETEPRPAPNPPRPGLKLTDQQLAQMPAGG